MGSLFQSLAVGIALTLIGSAHLAGAQTRFLNVDAAPVYSGAAMGGEAGSVTPYRITVSNAGEDAVGIVRVNAGAYSVVTPVELPKGSSKQILAYVPRMGYLDKLSIELETDRGSTTHEARNGSPGEYGGAKPILLVGDTEGEMTFLRLGGSPNADHRGLKFPRDVYCRPGMLPDRAIGFSCLRAVVLGAGAERLTSAEVVALKTWLVAGGTVVVIGGASFAVPTDARWSSLMPVTNVKTTTIRLPASLASLAGSAPPAGLTAVAAGTAASGSVATSSSGVPLIVSRPVGLGKVVFLAFNPFEPPLDKWPGRAKLLTRVTEPSFRATTFEIQGGSEYSSAYPSGYPRGGPGRSRPATTVDEGPFTVKLPETSIVVSILIAYLVLVVPINLLVLRKLGRSQWAWGTTPLISVAFAAIFFRFAGGLYAAKLSVADNGILVMDTRVDLAYYVGDAQLFFPRGGVYDLRMKGVEGLLGTNENEYDMRSRTGKGTMQALNAVDYGEICCDHMSVSNLSFHQFGYAQTIPATKWLDAKIRIGSRDSNRASGTITNRSRFTIRGELRYGGLSAQVPQLDPGKTVGIRDLVLAKSAPIYDPIPAELLGFGHAKRLLLVGNIQGFRPGPQIGEQTTQLGTTFVAHLSNVILETP